MASRIEFATIGQVDMSKYSKNQTFGAQTAGVDIGTKTQGGGSSSGNPDYTEDEQVTGMWFDKPRYQKTIVLIENGVAKYSKTGNTFTNSLPDDFGYINIKQMYALRNNRQWVDCMNIKNEMSLCIDIVNKGIYFETALGDYQDLVVTVEYTKTTD